MKKHLTTLLMILGIIAIGAQSALASSFAVTLVNKTNKDIRTHVDRRCAGGTHDFDQLVVPAGKSVDASFWSDGGGSCYNKDAQVRLDLGGGYLGAWAGNHNFGPAWVKYDEFKQATPKMPTDFNMSINLDRAAHATVTLTNR